MLRTIALALFLLLVSSCHKTALNYPSIPELEPSNISILDLKKLYSQAATFLKIRQNLRISGIVIANDETGNFYKKLIIQDSSGGLAINLDGYNLYKEYPLGRQISIKCQNLTLSDYGNSITLGLSYNPEDSSLNPIPNQLARNYISKGSFNHQVSPQLVSLGELGIELHNRYQNTLVKLTGLEGRQNDAGKTLADPQKRYPNRSYTLYNCTGQSIILRTSSYASFASALFPAGNGTIIGIFSPYVQGKKAEKNITLRSASDLNLRGERCPENPSAKPRGRTREASNSRRRNSTAPVLRQVEETS